MWDLIVDVDDLTNELEGALDTLEAVHNTMTEEEGVNWQRRCNAVFYVYLNLRRILDRLEERVGQAADELRSQRSATE